MSHNFSKDAPLVEIWRGNILECIHRGQVAVVDSSGAVLASHGSADQQVTLRSSAKPFQAIPLVESGAVDALGFDDADLALCCASHQGEPFHIEGVREILRKAGLNEDALRCGGHWPLGLNAQREARARFETPQAFYNNCSGKHAGMLATAVHLREDTADYEYPYHPVQRRIRDAILQFTDCPSNEVETAFDGCAVPTYAMPLWRIALAFSRLVQPEAVLPGGSPRVDACSRIVSAMQTYPEMVGGTERHFDTTLMTAAGGRVVAKGGAEGLACVAILPGACGNEKGIGIAVKITDGDARQIRSVPMLAALSAFGALNDTDMEELRYFAERPISNCRKDEVGGIVSRLELPRHRA